MKTLAVAHFPGWRSWVARRVTQELTGSEIVSRENDPALFIPSLLATDYFTFQTEHWVLVTYD